MKRFFRWAALILCILLPVLLAGCAQEPAPTTLPPTTAEPTDPPLTALERYTLGRQSIDNAENLLIDFSYSQERSVGNDVYKSTATGTASYSNLGKDSMLAIVEQQLSFGSYSSSYIDCYCDGVAVAVANKSNFSCDMTGEAFVDLQLPAVLLDGALYALVTMEEQTDATVITFSQGTALESWVQGAKQAQLISSGGTATLDSTGTLLQMTYEAQYQWEGAEYRCQFSTRVSAPKTLDLGAKHQEHFENCIPIADIRVPKLLLQVVGDVYASQDLASFAVETIYSEAIPMAYTQTSKYYLTGTLEELSAGMDYKVVLSDYRGDVSTTTQTDRFADGMFTTAVNGAEPAEQSWITAQQVRESCEDAILSAVFAPTYLADAQLEEKDDAYHLVLQGNEDYMQNLMKNITAFLQVDLDDQAQSYETTEAKGYLTICKATGLPTAAGMSFERSHTIKDITYQLTYRLEHTLALSQSKE